MFSFDDRMRAAVKKAESIHEVELLNLLREMYEADDVQLTQWEIDFATGVLSEPSILVHPRARGTVVLMLSKYREWSL